MYKECTSKQAITRQREIEEGLLDYMLHKSYEQITVLDLCEKLGIPRKAFYRYFSSKEGALYALIDHSLKDAFLKFDDVKHSIENRDQIILYFFKYWISKKPLLDSLSRNNLSGILLQRAIIFTMTDDIVAKFTEPLRTTEKAKNYRTVYIVSGIISLVIQWHHNNFDKTPQQIADIASDLLP
ncbi:MAG: TetR/AcrR family transcriptional regulator [Firmicutes bacterium]|nr:TetR/AcrR family transcriptional regulator [Bacillota bacterium]